jgi:mRNA interferase MazF
MKETEIMIQLSSKNCRVGDIVLVKFPFSDLKKFKQRPALVLAVLEFSSRENLFILSMVTSKIEGRSLQGDVLIPEWKEANLLHPSVVRLCKLVTVEETLILGCLGSLTPHRIKSIKEKLKVLFEI